MNRRGFLSALIGSGVAVAVDPERLLWTPGKKLISIPKPLVIPCQLISVWQDDAGRFRWDATFYVRPNQTVTLRAPARYIPVARTDRELVDSALQLHPAKRT